MAIPEGLLQQLNEEAATLPQTDSPAPESEATTTGQNPTETAPPASESKGNESAPSTEHQKSADTPQTTTEAQKSTEFDFTPFAQKAGREIKSTEDLLKWVEEASAKPEIPELDPELQSLKEWKAKDGKTEDWYSVHHTDWAKQAEKDPREVLFQYRKANNQFGLTDDEIRFQLDDEHPLPIEGLETDPDAIRAKIRLKTELGQALGYFNERKIIESTPAPERERQAIANHFQENVRQTTEKAMQLKELQFGDYKHIIPDAFKQETVASPESFLTKYVQLDAKGNVTGMNVEAITRDKFILENINAILGSHATHQAAKTITDLKKEIANPQTQVRHESAPQTDGKISDEEALARMRFGKR